MQSSVEEKLRPEVHDFHEQEEEKQEEELISRNEDEEDEEEGGADEEEEFSFTSSFGELSLTSADDAFVDGELKPVFPLFNRSLLFEAAENLPKKPAVKKIFVQAKGEEAEDHRHEDGDDVISGPYCDLSSRRVVEVASSSSSDSCKKSNSTGFSKVWRFKEHVSRTNSDGRDAFVFLDGPPRRRPEKTKAGVAVRSAAERVKASGGNKRTTPYSAHEVYLRRKGKEEKKRPSSYLPYRPELMGFFTTVNGGFSKNVHPY